MSVTAFLLKNEPTSVLYVAWLSSCGNEATVKASLNRAIWWRIHDPKPGELAMTRMKFRESGMEVRTHEPCDTRG
jgi:hypothetical protein